MGKGLNLELIQRQQSAKLIYAMGNFELIILSNKRANKILHLFE